MMLNYSTQRDSPLKLMTYQPYPSTGFLKIGLALLILSTFSLPSPPTAFATNGLNLIGFGTESAGMGGADIAVSGDISSMNINPAGLSQIRRGDIGLSISYLKPDLQHKGLGVSRADEDNPIILPNLGVAYRLKNSPFTIGIGLFTQGGISTDFKDIPTVFGNTDRSSSFIRHIKVTPSAAYQMSDRLSFGIAANISYLDTALRLFPNTSNAKFFGFETEDACSDRFGLGALGSCAWDIGYGIRAGLLYKINEMLRIGVTYNSPIRFNLSDADITFNLSGLGSGLGNVRYDASVKGFEWPQEAGIGIAVTPAEWFLVGFDIVWINWDRALNTLNLNATNPNIQSLPASLQNITVPFVFNWRDQYVFALGVKYTSANSLSLQGGYNFGRNPVPQTTLSPLAPVIVEQHLTAGVDYTLTKGLNLGLAIIYALKNKERSSDTNSLFGPDAEESVGGYLIDTMLNYRF